MHGNVHVRFGGRLPGKGPTYRDLAGQPTLLCRGRAGAVLSPRLRVLLAAQAPRCPRGSPERPVEPGFLATCHARYSQRFMNSGFVAYQVTRIDPYCQLGKLCYPGF
jgi:hypothetical protein